MNKLILIENKDKTMIILNGADITDGILEYTLNRTADSKNVAILSITMRVSIDGIEIGNKKINHE